MQTGRNYSFIKIIARLFDDRKPNGFNCKTFISMVVNQAKPASHQFLQQTLNLWIHPCHLFCDPFQIYPDLCVLYLSFFPPFQSFPQIHLSQVSFPGIQIWIQIFAVADFPDPWIWSDVFCDPACRDLEIWIVIQIFLV